MERNGVIIQTYALKMAISDVMYVIFDMQSFAEILKRC